MTAVDVLLTFMFFQHAVVEASKLICYYLPLFAYLCIIVYSLSLIL